jgi:protein SCO1/2
MTSPETRRSTHTYRWLMLGLAGLLLALLVAVVVVALGGSSRSSSPAGATGAGAVDGRTPGPASFRTAGTLPAGLAARPVPSFNLADARGGRFSSASLSGKPYAITFLYVHCVDVCPLIGSEIHQALANLGPDAKRMTVVAISVDPHGDTPIAVRRWLRLHQEPGNFHYLIGSARSLAPIWKAFYVSPQTPRDQRSSHTAVIWLVNRHARPAALIPAGTQINTADLAHDFRALLAGT